MFFLKRRTKVDSLSNTARARLETIAKVRNESHESVMARFSSRDLARAPASFPKHIDALRSTAFETAEVRDGLAYVKLSNGRSFYGNISKPNHQLAYEYVADLVPSILNEETFLLGIDIAQRYASDSIWPPKQLHPPQGGTVVECGAYLGHKTIRFADELVGPKGKVLAIEMMPDNVEILRRNIRENGLQDIIDVIEAGVWSKPDRLVVKGKGRQRNTLVDLAKLEEEQGFDDPVDSLDNILENWGQPIVDLLFVTVNGAEVEALPGINHSLSRIRGLHIVALYSRDGRQNHEICREILRDKGCKILESCDETEIVATTTFYQDP